MSPVWDLLQQALPGWPIGLLTAVAAGLLLWPVGARLALDPASRASAAALYATAAALVELNAPAGVDGRGAMLLALAACLAVGRTGRGLVAVLLTGLAIASSPVTGVGFLALLGAMCTAGALARRFPVPVRRLLAAGCGVAAAALATRLLRPEAPMALPAVALGALTLWTLLISVLLWRRMRWLRPVATALLAMLVCCWLPGPDADAVVVVAAVGGLLTALLAAEYPTLILRRAVPVTVAALALTGTLLTPGDSRQVRPVALPVAVAARALPPGPAGMPDAEVRPVTIAIPTLGVAGPLENLTADATTGELAAPDDPSRAGWYAAGVVPGDAGPAVVGGHVDSRAGPGIFFGLHQLQPGDEIAIARSDGRTVRFAVTAVARYPKTAFPSAAVYGPAPGPELRLVTCGGQFDRVERSYRDNVVVDAVLL